MIRISEMVLPGHPDKFSDQIADAVVAECLSADAEASCQVEVGVWSDQVWLSGGTCTRRPLRRSLAEIVVDVGLAIGYRPGNHVDAARYKVTDTVCQLSGDPTRWTHHVNDQCIVVGWAGYDVKTHWMPPEHFISEGPATRSVEFLPRRLSQRLRPRRKAYRAAARRGRPLDD